MKPRHGAMMRCIVGLLIAIGLALPTGAPAADGHSLHGKLERRTGAPRFDFIRAFL